MGRSGVTSGAVAAPSTLTDPRVIARALPVLACLIVLLLPAVAAARTHEVSLDRGEIAISYEGSGSTDLPTGLNCPGTNPCVAFGNVGYSLSWEATAVADKYGNISE